MTLPAPRAAEGMESASPDLILASSGLEAWARELLPGRDVLLFDDVLSGRRAVDADTNALVLWSPKRQPLSRTADILEALSSQNAGFGLVPCDDRDLARAFLARTLASPEVADRGRTGVVSSAFAPHGRPACVAASDAHVPELVRSDLDVLLIHGHGNSLDLDLGTRAVLCSRAAVGQQGGEGLFHCFSPGGQCFRKLGDHADAELIDPRSVDASLLIAVSCNVLQLGRGAFSSRVGVLPSLLASRVVAAIVTTGVTTLGAELVVLALSFIHEGRTLADAARLLNRFHASHGVVSGLAPGYSPFVVIGNPCARLAAAEVHTARVAERQGGGVVAQVGPLVPAGPRGTFVKVPLAPTDLEGARVPDVCGLGAEAWKKAVVAGADRERAAYVWLGPDARIGEGGFSLEPRPARATVERLTLESCATRLSLWEEILDWYRQDFCARPSRARVVDRLLLGVVRLRRHLSTLAAAIGDGRAPPGSFDASLDHLRLAGAQLLATCVDLAIARGVPDLGQRSAMRLTGAVGEGGRCACGESTLRYQTYAATGGGLRRYQCACGDAGQDSADTSADLLTTERRARRGEAIRFEFRHRAPADRLLFAQTLTVIEPWQDKRRAYGAIVETLLEPGDSAVGQCELRVPKQLAAGLYPVSVLGIVNGGLMHRKTFFRIED